MFLAYKIFHKGEWIDPKFSASGAYQILLLIFSVQGLVGSIGIIWFYWKRLGENKSYLTNIMALGSVIGASFAIVKYFMSLYPIESDSESILIFIGFILGLGIAETLVAVPFILLLAQLAQVALKFYL